MGMDLQTDTERQTSHKLTHVEMAGLTRGEKTMGARHREGSMRKVSPQGLKTQETGAMCPQALLYARDFRLAAVSHIFQNNHKRFSMLLPQRSENVMRQCSNHHGELTTERTQVLKYHSEPPNYGQLCVNLKISQTRGVAL